MAEGEPVCSNCQITTSPIWRRNEEGKIVCLDCSSSQKKQEKVSNTETNRTQPAVASGPSITTRKKRGKRNARGGVEKASVNSINQTSQQKGRRSLLKGKVSDDNNKHSLYHNRLSFQTTFSISFNKVNDVYC